VTETKPVGQVGRANGKTILVVEGDDLNRTFFVDVLEANGYAAVAERDAARVLELARERRPDLVMLGVRLAGTSGLEAARLLKADAEAGQIPIIAVTALASRQESERIVASGCDGYLVKPVAIANLVAAVRRHTGETVNPGKSGVGGVETRPT